MSVERKRWSDSDGNQRSQTYIFIKADKDVKFGSIIPEQRRKYLAGILLTALVPSQPAAGG